MPDVKILHPWKSLHLHQKRNALSVRKSFMALSSFLSLSQWEMKSFMHVFGCVAQALLQRSAEIHVSNVWSMPPGCFFLCLGKSHQRVECRRHSNTQSYRYTVCYGICGCRAPKLPSWKRLAASTCDIIPVEMLCIPTRTAAASQTSLKNLPAL